MGEGSYNVLKGSTVAYGEATNKTGYNYKWENIVTYHNTFNKDHDLTVTGVTSWNYNQSEEYYVYGENPATNDMLWYALQNADNKKLNSKYLMSKGMGFIGRVNYSYKGKYLFSASSRYEADSRLSKDNIEEKLRNHGVSEELIKEFLNALNDCEFARFAPGDENQAMDKVYSSSIEVISKMENSIKH